MRPEAELDIECRSNWFLVGITDHATNTRWEFQATAYSPLDTASIAQLLQHYTIVTFNGTDYDVPMLTMALAGVGVEQLKYANDCIIEQHINCWAFYKKFQIRPPYYLDHIDVAEPTPGVKISLKQYAGRVHAPTMLESAVDFSLPIPAEEVLGEINYCINDRHVTRLIRDGIADRMNLRFAVNEQYAGLDVRSKSDAQIAEAIVKHEWTRLISESEQRYRDGIPGDYPHLAVNYTRDWNDKPKVIIPHYPHGTTFKCKIPEYVHFVTPELQKFLAMVRNVDFFISNKDEAELMGIDEKKIKTGVILPAELKGHDIIIGAAKYRVGIGGLHSQEQSVKHVAVPGVTKLKTADVRSYYPSLILNAGMYPPQLGPLFLEIYNTIFVSRLAAKKALKQAGLDPAQHSILKTREGGYKIVLNGTFGKLFSRFSIFYAPELGIAVTIGGQLSLLMLIERLDLIGATVVSANTDGIEIMVPLEREWMVDSVILWWEQHTGLGMDQEEYAALYSRDVNNYISVHHDGTTKRKGVFRESGLVENKHPDCDICADAVVEFLVKGTPLISTIMACTDIRKFVRIRGVTGGATFNGQYLGKAVRWYYGQGNGHIVAQKTGNKVAGSDGATPCMVLPTQLPADINYQVYLDMAESMLEDIGFGVQH